MNRMKINLKNFSKYFLFLIGLFLIQCVQKERVPTSVTENVKKPASADPISTEKLTFEVCSSDRKNYLEKQMLFKVDPTYLHNHEQDSDQKIPMKCIQFAQQNFRGAYAYCESPQDRPITTAPRPCLTENYTT